VALGPVVAYSVYQRFLYPDWKQRMAFMPVLALLGTGLGLANTVSIVKGLFLHDRDFMRTPKFHVVRRGDRWLGNRYVLPFQWISLAELALAGYALATALVAIAVANYFAVPFLLLYVGGYAYLGLNGLTDAVAPHRRRPRLRRASAVADS